jgi:hypothetical protein
LSLFAVLITYGEVIGKKAAIEDLHAILARYKRADVIAFLGKVNCLLGTCSLKSRVDFRVARSELFLMREDLLTQRQDECL